MNNIHAAILMFTLYIAAGLGFGWLFEDLLYAIIGFFVASLGPVYYSYKNATINPLKWY